MKANGYVVQFFPQKRTALVHTRVQLRSSNSFSEVPILMAADKPCPQLQPSLLYEAEESFSNLSLLAHKVWIVSLCACFCDKRNLDDSHFFW